MLFPEAADAKDAVLSTYVFIFAVWYRNVFTVVLFCCALMAVRFESSFSKLVWTWTRDNLDGCLSLLGCFAGFGFVDICREIVFFLFGFLISSKVSKVRSIPFSKWSYALVRRDCSSCVLGIS